MGAKNRTKETPMTKPADDAAIRKYAEKALKKKNEFKQFMVIYAVVSLITVGVWFFVTPAGYFWPGWVMFGMGVAALFAGLDAYGKLANKPITQADIDAEVERLKTKR
jgi:uncharacterized membrane protein